MNDTTSQVNKLLAHLRGGGTVTSYEAYAQFGITQLAARITDIEQQGVAISRTPEKRNGKRFVRYALGVTA